MNALALALLALLAIFAITHVLMRGRKRQHAYTLRPTLSTAAEVKFLRALETAIDGKYAIHQQVALSAILKPTDRRGRGRSKISQKRLDFVLAEHETTKPVCVVELNDKSHDAEHRQQRDAFLAYALEGNLPLLVVKYTATYNPAALRKEISYLTSPQAQQARE